MTEIKINTEHLLSYSKVNEINCDNITNAINHFLNNMNFVTIGYLADKDEIIVDAAVSAYLSAYNSFATKVFNYTVDIGNYDTNSNYIERETNNSNEIWFTFIDNTKKNNNTYVKVEFIAYWTTDDELKCEYKIIKQFTK